MKRCPACGEDKPFDAFNKSSRRADGRQPYCRACSRAIDRLGYATNRERIRVRRNSPESRRRRQASTHGMTLDQLDALIARFDGKCWVCREAKGTLVDHCHRSERRRGWLCHPCNVMLGMAKDSPERLRAAADYLAA